ncbi:MAG: right-handed parallel beta-helix repeat-containing protein, partial [Bacteroidales bacterium]|nr:right-handed parallel beta-helix repeat-containing protein [Bacteroidales bacterium]
TAGYSDVRLYSTQENPHGFTPATITIEENILRNGYHGIYIKSGDLTTRTGVTVNQNSIYSHSTSGITNDATTGVLDAESNYWGTVNCSEIAAMVDGDVDYLPFCNSTFTVCTYDCDLSEVWVDDSWAASSPGDIVGGHTFGYDAFAVIQDGIDAVDDPGTVNVAAGPYYEEVSIVGIDNLTITGAGQGNTIIAPYREYTTGNNGISIDNADGITIQQLTVDGFANIALTPGVAHYKDGVHWGNIGGNDCVITYVTVNNTDRRGISVWPETVTNNEITYCTINNVTAATYGYGHAIKLNGSGKVENCIISNSTAGILGNNNVVGGTLSIQDNVITNLTGLTSTPFDIGMNFWCKQSNVITVKNNQITANVADNGGIYVVRGGDGSEISGNTITLTGDGGLGIETGWENAWGFPIHTNTITMGRGGTGILVTGAGTDTDPMLIYNNDLSNVGADDLFNNDYTGEYSLREVGLLLSGSKFTSRTGDADYPFFGNVYDNTVDGFKDGIVLISDLYDAGGFNQVEILYSDENSFTNYEKAARYGYDLGVFVEIDIDDPNYLEQDLSMNYWGSATPDFPNVIDGKIEYCQFYEDAGFTTTSCPPVTNIDQGTHFFTIQSAIADPFTYDGHTIEVSSGPYDEQVIVNKELTINGVGATKPVVDFTGTVSGKTTLFDVQADAVTIDNMQFNVDVTKLHSAIVASATNLDNITITDNDINPYQSTPGTYVSGYGDRNAIGINYAGYRVATGGVDNITLTDNTVTATVVGAYVGDGDDIAFRSGVSVDEGAGTYTGNTFQSISHDILVRFTNATNGNLLIDDNGLNGGGVQFADPNATGTVTVSNNTFDGTYNTLTSSLRLQNNYPGRTTTVSGNTFNNHLWGISLENYNSVTIDDNDFTPLTGSTDFRHISTNTKSISTNSNSIVQVTIDGIYTNNTFNGSGTPGGIAMVFLNHDSDNASFGTFTLGGVANENEFNLGIANFIWFDSQTGSSDGSTWPPYSFLIGSGADALTTMACWDQDIDARYNEFDVGSGLQLPINMNATERAGLEAAFYHLPDNSCLGEIKYFLPVTNLTKTTKYLTIAEAIADADPTNVLELAAWTFNERVVIDKSLTLQGVSEAGCIIDGSTMTGNGDGIFIQNNVTDVTIKYLTIQNFLGANGLSDAGIYANSGNDNLTVEHVTIQNNVGGSGFYANGPLDNVTLDYVTSSGHTTGARGIVIWNGLKSNITITNCEVFNNNCCGIELQDGTASGVTMEYNNVHDNGDNGMSAVGLTSGDGANSISHNMLADNGRFGIEIKNPDGTGLTTGDGSILVDDNTVERTIANTDSRDHAGIAVFRRGVIAGNTDIPTGVVVTNNTVKGYRVTGTSTSEGFGIVIEGVDHSVSGNILDDNDVALQLQGGGHPNSNYPGDGSDADNLSQYYFGRGNAQYMCNITVGTNTFGGTTANGIDTRMVIEPLTPITDAGIIASQMGVSVVLDDGTTQTTYCSIQGAVDRALGGQTPDEIITASASTFVEDVTVDKSLTILGQGPASTIVQPTAPANVAFTVSVDDVTIKDLEITEPTGLANGIQAISPASTGLWVENVHFTNFATIAGNSYGINILNSFSDLDVIDCEFLSPATATYTRGIGVFAGNNYTLSDFDITGSTFEYLFVGVYLRSAIDDLYVFENTFGPFEIDDCTAAVAGVYIGDGDDNNFDIENILVTENDFINYGRGVYVWNYAANSTIDNFVISDNTFTNSIWSSSIRFILGYNGMEDYYIDKDDDGIGIDIDNNEFTQNSGIGNVALVDFRTYDATLLSCNVSVTDNDMTFSGGAYTNAMYGIRFLVGGDGFYNTTASGNTLNGGNAGGAGNPASSGINVYHYATSYTWTNALDIDVLTNKIGGFDNGVSIYDADGSTYGGLPSGSDLDINENDLSGNNLYGIISGTGETTDATCNWWGSEDASDVEAETSGDVQFLPYLIVDNNPSGTSYWWDNVDKYSCDGVGSVLVYEGSTTTIRSSHMTIQGAIDDANTQTGDRVWLSAGTYPESAFTSYSGTQVDFDGEVDGSGNPLATIKGNLYLDNADGRYIKNLRFEVDATELLTLKNTNGLDITDCIFDGNILSGNSGEFLSGKNGINHVSGPNGNSDITVEDCLFKNGLYVGINSRITYLTVETTEFTNVKSGINQMGGNNLLVTDCNFSVEAQANTSDTYGIRFASDVTENLTVSGCDFIVDKNGFTATGSDYHAAVIIRANAAGTLKVNESSMGGEVVNLSLVPLDATCNWWGSEDAGVVAAAVSGAVQFLPYLVEDPLGVTYPWSGTDTYSCDGEGPVKVYDGDPLVLGTLQSSHMTIQDGIDAAVANDFVDVDAGIYPEYLHINKDDLTIQGAGIDQSIIDLDGLIPYYHYDGCNKSFASRAGVYFSGYGSTGDVIEGCTFTGFTVKNAGLNPPITESDQATAADPTGTVLTDGTASFPTDGSLVGQWLHNVSDKLILINISGNNPIRSYGQITANTATTITATLASGQDNDWETGDTYVVIPYEWYVDIAEDLQDDVPGIGIANGKDITISYCKSINNGGTGIYASYARCTSAHNYSEGVTIDYCISSDNPRNGISIGKYIGAVTITNNTSSNNGSPHITDPSREYMGSGIVVAGLNSGNPVSGLISDNVCDNNGFEGIVLQSYSDGVTIENNTVTGHNRDQDGAGIFFYGGSSTPSNCDNHIIRDNEVTGNIRGIVAYYAENCTIGGATPADGNTITTNSGSFPLGQGGIKLDGANNMLVQNNTLSSLDGIGIKIQKTWNDVESYDNTITENTITGAQFAGIPIWGGAHDNTFTYNTITGTTVLTFWSGETYEETQADGVFLDDDAGTGNVFNYNSIYGNAGDGMENQVTTMTVDAEDNYWGHASGPYHPVNNTCGTGDAVSDYVDFMPWWTTATGGTGTLAVNNTIKGTYYCTIQDAIDDADTDDEIEIGTGIYAQDLYIDVNGLELRPKFGEAVTIKGVATEPVAAWPLATENIDIAANGVKIHGFTIESPTIADGYYSSGIVINGTDVVIYDNDFVFDGTVTHDSRAVGIQTRRVDALPTADVAGLHIYDNDFGGVIGTRGYYGIYINRDQNLGTVTIE